MAKRLRVVGASVALLAAWSGVAFAQSMVTTLSDGPYIGGAIGANDFSDLSPHGGFADVPSYFRPGYVGLGSVGYGFGNGWRAEIEGGYRRADVKFVRNSVGNTSGGALGVESVMLNGIYDIDVSQFGLPSYGVLPHVGLGVGWARPRFDHATSFNGNALSGSDDVLAYQGIIGVDCSILPDLKVTLDYHYLGTGEGKFASLPGDTSYSGGQVTRTSVTSNAVLLGLRYEFNPPPPQMVADEPPPPPPPAPVVPPVVAPAPAPELRRSFQVFFDFNKSDLTEAATRIIADAAENVRAGKLTRLTATGHTDTVGSAKYNQTLSEQRAAAVKRQLIADGVPADAITVVGVGKSGLLVPTADGVREPQNRRAEIMLE